MAKKTLPIGIQDFPKLVGENFLYVDKTAYCYRLLQNGEYFFLSRPRRFGKSLLVSTLKAIFEGKRELFQGLWIEDKIDWVPRPVIMLDFTKIVNIAPTLVEGISAALDQIAEANGLQFSMQTNAGKLQELIEQLGKENKVAILVDEYDKPLIDKIDSPEALEQNRKTLKELYSVLKGNDSHISFLMLTGVTKFSQVSIFSDLNHLTDITFSSDFGQMLGYTEAEILKYFPEQIQRLQASYEDLGLDVMTEVKAWYNGYSWDGIHHVYNPFSILNLFFNNEFGEFWFATGTPTFLMKLIRSRNYSIFDLEQSEVSMRSINRFDVPQMELTSLLFQTGYLTIKSRDRLKQSATLDFPNKEVSNAFSAHLLAEFSEKGEERTNSLVWKMAEHLRTGAVAAFIESLKSLFAGIAYVIQPAGQSGIENHEKYYHSMFYLALRLLGYDIHVEVLTHNGRIDAVVTVTDRLYVIEFKLGDAASAMAQINEKAYHLPYLGSGKKVVLLGIGFDVQTRNVGGFLMEEVG